MNRFLVLLSAAVLAASAAAAASPGAAADYAGFVSAWRQDCTNGCGVPAGAGPGQAAAFRLDVPMNPGEARTTKFEREFVLAPTGERIKAAFTVYAVCPHGAKPEPGGDSCPSRYVQIQAVLSGDARAFCAASLNDADARPFPVMMCAGENLRRPGERLGISLSRQAVAALAP
ncbi:MAG: hypothetical protein ACHQ51_05675 [Elusimicrobiota bacterium]